MRRTVLRSVFGVCCSFWPWLAIAGEVTQPAWSADLTALGAPAPDPADPVDYLAWYNGRNGGPPQDNAFDAYLAAYEQLARFTGDWGQTLVAPWSKEPHVAAWLQANQDCLVLFRRAAARSDRDFFFRLSRNQELAEPRLRPLLLAWEKPGWVGHLHGARGLIAASWRAWHAGDEELLRENALLALRAAHHLQGTCWPIARLVGDGAARPAYAAIRHALARSRDPAAWASGIAAALQRDDPPPPPFAHACSLLRVEHWDLVQRVFLPREEDGRWPVHRGVIQALAPLLRGEPEILAEQLAAIGQVASLRESDG